MSERGDWIKFYRKIKDSYVWNLKPIYSKIWITILLSVNWKETEMEFGGKIKTIYPGQLVTGQKELADMASGEEEGAIVSRQNVRTALEKFEKAGMITKESTSQGSLITVENWGQYQQTGKEVTNDPTNHQPTTNQQLTSYEESKESTRSTSTYSELFDFWVNQSETISHRKMSGKMKSAIKARLKDFELHEIMQAILNYNRVLKSDDYFFEYDNWSLDEFLSRGEGAQMEKFLVNPEGYRKDDADQKTETHSGVELPPPLADVREMSDDVANKKLRGYFPNSDNPVLSYISTMKRIKRNGKDPKEVRRQLAKKRAERR